MDFAAVLNTAGGTLKRRPVSDVIGVVEERLGAAGHRCAVETVEPQDLREALREAKARRDIDALRIGGGDDTASAATEPVGGETPLGVRPLGTMNLFARDLGVPLELGRAVDALAAGTADRIDLGDANGHLFINHCSVGIHPWMVRHRKHQQHAGRANWPAMIRAWIRALRRRPGPVPEHDRLDRHVLAVYIGRSLSRPGSMRLGLDATTGHWRDKLEAVTCREVALRRRRRHIRVSVDGESRMLRLPVRSASRPEALKVITPRTAE